MIFWRQTLVYRDCFVYNKVVWYVRLKESDCSIKEKVKKYFYKKIGGNTCGLFKHNESKSKGRQEGNRSARVL